MHAETTCPVIARKLHISRQQERHAYRKKVKEATRRQCHLLPTRNSEDSFLKRLDKRGIIYLGKFQRKMKCLIAQADRLEREHGADSMPARLVAEDKAVWERLLALAEGLIAKRTLATPRRDARPKRIQKMTLMKKSADQNQN